MTVAPGTRLGAYEVVAPLGAGGMGEVYRARDARLGRDVAIKVLPAALASAPERLKRFAKEARAASALNHPTIVTVYDIGETEGVSWIAMELVEGKTLRDALAGGALPVKRTLQIGASVAEGLARAHEAGVVHRDLKPENVMVSKDGHVKILDFGLAKLTSTLSGSGEGSQLPTMTGTTPGVVVGTVGYMSPEQASGEAQDFRSDQFALGSILYELTTGKRAFLRKTAVDTLAAILNDEPEPIAAIKPQTPAPLRWVIERCLAKDPEERYVATRDLARDLATLRDRIAETGSGEAVVQRPTRKALWKALAAAAGIAVASLLAGRLLWKTPPPSQPTFQRLTFGHGYVDSARFTPDGRTIVYSAMWDGKPPHLYLTRPEAPESQRLDLPDGTLMSVSKSGELAIVMGKMAMSSGPWYTGGILATVPLAGGTPREIAEDIRFAEWGPDGAQAIVFRGDQLQYPVGGRVLHRGEGIHPRLSPAGDRLAYSDRNQVHVLDLAGRELLASKRVEDQGRFAVRSLAWSASGDEVLFTVGGGAQTKLVAMDRKGRERPLMTQPRGMAIYDVSRDGRVLLNVERGRREVWVGSTGEIRERNLSVFATANAMGISADGTQLLDNEDTGYYLLRTDGTPPKKLGNDAFATELSADGKWAVVVRKGPPMQLVLVPTGSGQERVLERGPIDEYEPTNVRWSQDGRVLLFGAREKGKEAGRFWIQDVRQGPPRPLAPEGVGIGWSSISADGRFVVIEAADGHWIYPTDGGERKAVSGFLKTDFAWRNTSPDGRYLYAWDLERLPFEVSRVDLQTGKREPWKTIAPQDPSGITLADLMITPDGKSYAYNCTRQLSDLFLVTGVH